MNDLLVVSLESSDSNRLGCKVVGFVGFVGFVMESLAVMAILPQQALKFVWFVWFVMGVAMATLPQQKSLVDMATLPQSRTRTWNTGERLNRS